MGALYQADAYVLHLGTGFEVATVFHLGEWRAGLSRRDYRCKVAGVMENGGWVEFEDVDYRDSDFPLLGESFERETGCVKRARVGSADALLYPVRSAADHALVWVKSERQRVAGPLDLLSAQGAAFG